jgi:hypothetical protein
LVNIYNNQDPTIHNVANASLATSVCPQNCRKTTLTLPYISINNVNKVNTYLAGFIVNNVAAGVDPVFGVLLDVTSIGISSFNLQISVYGQS